MNTPPEALQWLQEKCSRERWATVTAERASTRTWVRQTGGRVMRAGLAGTIKPSDAFHIMVADEGVAGEYVAAAKNAALTVLISQSWEPVFRVRLSLYGFKVHDGESSYAAVYNAAHELVSHLIGVAPGSKHNIKW